MNTMDKVALGLIGVGVAFWLVGYLQQNNALAAGTITQDQTLTWSDRLYSPAGVAVLAGLGLLGYNKFVK